jgi:hypothetical protein
MSYLRSFRACCFARRTDNSNSAFETQDEVRRSNCGGMRGAAAIFGHPIHQMIVVF